MIYLFTGTPGSGKTLNAIKFALQDSRFKNRPVYVHNINGLNVPDWEVIDQQQAINWFDLPDCPVIIVDECQDIWRPSKVGAPVPETIQRLEKNRHQGIDLILTCQYPRQINIGVRRMVNVHRHLFRPFGAKKISQLQWEKCEDAPSDYHAQQKAQKSRFKLDTKIFDLYKSAELHTVKRVLPKKLYWLIGLCIALVTLIFFIVSLFAGIGEEAIAAPSDQSTQQRSYDVFSPRGRGELTVEEYGAKFVTDRTPSIPDMPESAKVYEGLMKAKSKPRPHCISSTLKATCVCYSQQATKLNISKNSCYHYIANGYDFDPTIPDVKFKANKRKNDKSNLAGAAADDYLPIEDRVTVIERSDNPRYPTADNSYQGI